MKRLLAFLLMGVLVFAFAACGGKENEPTPEPPAEYDPDAGIDYESEKHFIVQGGEALYRIVVPQDATAAEQFAAEELNTYVDQSSSVSLTIEEDAGDYAQTDKIISVGKTSALETYGPDVDYAELNHDGFIIYTAGDIVLIDGASDRGTLYGVYDFLEKFIGVRFLTQTSTYIPEKDEIYVHDLTVKEAPTFSMRTFLSKQIVSDPLFGAHTRMSSVWAPSMEAYGGSYAGDFYDPQDHSFFMLVPPDVYYEDHKDWYSPDKTQLCLTNEGLVQQAIENLKAWILSEPNARYFMVGQEDSHPLCNCENCTASDAANGGKAGTLMIFINRLAEAIEEWQKTACPDREITIVTFAYQSTINAPVKTENGKTVPVNNDVIPRDNVMVKIAIIDACYFHEITDESCTKNILTRTVFDQWSALTDRMCLWDYNTNFTNHLWYFANLGVLKSNLIKYEQMGMEYILTQGGTMISEDYQSQLKGYIFSKLLWNPHRDVNAIIEEFNLLHFGEDVAPYINEYLRRMELHFKMLDEGKTAFHSELYHYGTYFNSENYPIGLLQGAIDILETARDVVAASDRSELEKETIDQRIVSVLITPQMMVLQNYSNYYLDGKEREFAQEFFKNTDSLGMVYYSEGGTIASLNDKYGL